MIFLIGHFQRMGTFVTCYITTKINQTLANCFLKNFPVFFLIMPSNLDSYGLSQLVCTYIFIHFGAIYRQQSLIFWDSFSLSL
mgnify:CR=1 FL=1